MQVANPITHGNMNENQKTKMKLFSAPVKKSTPAENSSGSAAVKKTKQVKKFVPTPTKERTSVENCTGSSFAQKPTSSAEKTNKKSKDARKIEAMVEKPDPVKLVEKETNHENRIVKKGKEKRKAKAPPKPLTDEEYAEIFNSVLNPAVDEDVSDDGSRECTTDNKQDTSSKLSTQVPAASRPSICEDELSDIDTNLPIDEWNDVRSHEDDCENNENNIDIKVTSFSPKKKEQAKTKAHKIDVANIVRAKNALLNKAQNMANRKSVSNEAPGTANGKNMPNNKTHRANRKSMSIKASNISNGKNKSSKNDRFEKDMENTDDDDEEEEDEETGTWVQCSITDCSKWRYVPDISDPASVLDHWDCTMNSDKERNTCDAPEVDYDESEHILTKYTLGSLVWVKMDGFPWWPAMVDTDPDYDTYFELPTATSMIPHMYHVTFVDEQVSRAWVRTHLIMPYDHRSAPINKINPKSRPGKKDLNTAVSNANKALKLNLQDRLDKYSFLKRYSRKSKPRRPLDSDIKKKTEKGKRNTTREILSSPDAMMRELEAAIETCQDSEDSDFSEDDQEYLPHKSRRHDPTQDQKQIENEDSQCVQGSHSDSDSDAEEKAEDKQHELMKFDPDIFTMEFKPSESSDKKIESDHASKSDNCSDSCDEKEESARLKAREKSDDQEDNELEPKGKDRKRSENLLQDSPVPGKKKRKSLSVKPKKEDKKKGKKKATPLTIPSVDKTDHDDSGKENRDPFESEHEELTIPDSKRKNQSCPENDVSTKKLKKTNLNESDGAERKKKSSKGDSKSKTKPKATYARAKRVEEKDSKDDGIRSDHEITEIQTSDTELSGFNNPKHKTKGIKSLGKTDKTVHAETSRNGDCQDTIMQSNEQIDATKTDKSHNETIVSKKVKRSSRGFSIPAKKKSAVSNSGDRNVPGNNPDDQQKTSKKKDKQRDQFVPDLTNEIMEEEEEVLELTKNEQLNIKPIGDSKPAEEENSSEKVCIDEEDDDNLNLSIDSLENECLDINVCDETKNEECDVTKDKHPYGKFGGHCSEHGSDSDPFELIED